MSGLEARGGTRRHANAQADNRCKQPSLLLKMSSKQTGKVKISELNFNSRVGFVVTLFANISLFLHFHMRFT